MSNLTVDLDGTFSSKNPSILDDPVLVELDSFLGTLRETLDVNSGSEVKLKSLFGAAYADFIQQIRSHPQDTILSKITIKAKFEPDTKELKFSFEARSKPVVSDALIKT